MKKSAISLLSLLLYLGLSPITVAATLRQTQSTSDSHESVLLTQRRGGARRSMGNRSGRRGINRSSLGASGSNRINRGSINRGNRPQQTINRGNMNLSRDRGRSNRIQRPQNRPAIENRPNVGNRNPGDRIQRPNRETRINNIDRNNVQNRIDNRDLNLNRDRNFSNRIDRDHINVGNRVNIGDRNIVVNPRRGGVAWGWNRGVAWYPNYGYWGGGFWGAFAIGAATSAVIGAAINNNNETTYVENNYYVVEQGTPGYNLLQDYSLTQIPCDGGNLVVIQGPENSVICARPNATVPAGTYTVDPSTLTLIVAE